MSALCVPEGRIFVILCLKTVFLVDERKDYFSAEEKIDFVLANKVLRMSEMIVIGPTPPGTGVI